MKKLYVLSGILLVTLVSGCIFDDDNNDKKTSNNQPPAVTSGIIFMTTSDFISGDTAEYTIENGTFTDNVLPHYQDACVKTDGQYLYIIEALGADNLIKFDPASVAAGSQIYQYSFGENVNPHDIVFLDTKAYAILNSSDKLWIINQNAADEASFKIGEIDISAWADGDGSPEAHLGFTYNGMVYVILQRYDFNTYTAGNSTLIMINPDTDTIVDMDPDTEGIQGVELIIKNVVFGACLNNTLYLAGSTYGMSDEGVITVNLDNPSSQSKILDEEALGGQAVSVHIFEDGYGLIVVSTGWPAADPYVFNTMTNHLGAHIQIPGVSCIEKVGDKLYIGSDAHDAPGMYIVDAKTLEIVGDIYPTTLPPYSMVYIGE